ncbi:MAG: hypothetical protein QXD05_00035 [Candidatus Pacearchaeota archaeon]
MRIEIEKWMEEHGETIEDYYDDRKERINELTFSEAYKIAKDHIVNKCLDDDEFWEAIKEGIMDTWHNKENMLEELLDMIGNGKGQRLEKYIKELIYDEELLK